MRILVTGNMGYIGPVVVAHLRAAHPDATLLGLDAGYFAHCLTGASTLPERHLDCQYLADVRSPPREALAGVDAVVHLAAVSNDPIGKAFEDVTYAVNHRATVELARAARAAGARSFVFASSCSMYGFGADGMRTEESPLDPLTAYARSKVAAERDLLPLADEDFLVTSLRFATACGMSERVRLDLVLNDFVAGAVAEGTITILSDGTPWRPLIHVRDMARAVEWSLARTADEGGAGLVVNVGSDDWNYRIRDLAEAVADAVPGVEVTIARDAQPDRRSYRVAFDLYARLAPDHQPDVRLDEAIADLWNGLRSIGFDDAGFRASPRFVRLATLNQLRAQEILDEDLAWTASGRAATPSPRPALA